MNPEQTPPGRARARGRARGIIPPQLDTNTQEEEGTGGNGDGSPPAMATGVAAASGLLEHMYGGNGNGNGNNGNGNGNGNGSGSPHEEDSGSDRGRGSPGDRRGSPRGGSPQGPGGNGNNGEHEIPDYVRSRPAADFNKKGVTGQPIKTITNYYQFRTHPEYRMTLYSVTVDPQIDEDRKLKGLIRTNKDALGAYLISGRQFFATRPLRNDLLTFAASFEDTPDDKYTIKLERIRDVAGHEPIVFQFYNIVVRHIQRKMNYQLLGRHYFDPQQKVDFPSWRLELWPGFNNSIRQQELAIMMNVESCWKVLQTESVFQKMMAIRQQNPNNFQQACDAAIVGMMVITKYNCKAYKVDLIDYKSNPNSTFETKKGPKTYMDYYRERYGITINNDKQPMLVSKPKIRDIRRGQVGDIYLVPELCFPCGLNDELRSNFRLMKDLAGCLHMPPSGRVVTMERFITGARSNAEIQAYIKSWNIQLSPNPVELTGRMLPPEEIVCGNSQVTRLDDKADWTNAFRSQKMMVVQRLARWAIVVTSRDSQGVQNLVGVMQRVSTPLGYMIAPPNPTIRLNDNRGPSYVDGVSRAMDQTNGQLDMIFIILANNNAETYGMVKKRCSIDYGIPSQCFLAKNMNNAKGLMSICTKMVIQMNAKQGGEPWGIKTPLKNIMVLGYDVHHAGPGGGGMSIGAMTATFNETLGRCYSTVARLSSREEVATAVGAMFEKCLNAYFQKNNRLPERIMMYRDGVGEGQLNAVFNQELEGFQNRIKATYQHQGVKPPKLTYIVVNKRISTRFFEVAGRNLNNPRPGFIVDDVVTRPERFDFYLVSQTARQGCVSPTYYNVLHDESDLGPDKIQRYTFKLCHLYYNWTGTVAVPGPCQNAHKLALLVGTALKRPADAKLAYLMHFL